MARLDPKPGERWLDLACGTGAVAERAARAGADVVGIDLAPALIESAQERSEQQSLEIEEHVSTLETRDGEEYWQLFSTSYGPARIRSPVGS